MARGTQLSQLIMMLRAETGQSTSVAVGVDAKPALIQKLSRTQELLYDKYDWPFLRKIYTIDLAAGDRYYDLPSLEETNASNVAVDAGLNMERIEEVAINYSGRPLHVDRGIGFTQYQSFNSDNGDRSDPVRRWDIKRTSASAEQIEVWPIPASDTQLLLFKGIRKLRPLQAENDVADLDDQLIVLTCAAEILARAKAADAGAVAAAASDRYKILTGRVKASERIITMSGSSAETKNLGKTIIRIGSTTN